MNVGHFPPPKRRGLIIHSLIILVLAIIAVFAFINLTRADVGPAFLTSLLVALASFTPIPFLVYRAYSLLNADYHLDRDSLAIKWGLRVEDIPLTDIEFIRSSDDLTTPLRLPSLPIPGGLLGMRRHPDLGAVEFLASDSKKLLLVATAKRVFVISPENPSGLTQTFARATELGSLVPRRIEICLSIFCGHTSMGKRSGALSLADHAISQFGFIHLGKPHHSIRADRGTRSAIYSQRTRNSPIITAHYFSRCQSFTFCDRLDRRLIFFPLGKRTRAGFHRLGLKHADEFIVPARCAFHYYESCLRITGLKVASCRFNTNFSTFNF